MNYQPIAKYPEYYNQQIYTKSNDNNYSNNNQNSGFSISSNKNVKSQMKINSPISQKRSLKKINVGGLTPREEKIQYHNTQNYLISAKLLQQQQYPQTKEKISIKNIQRNDSIPKQQQRTNSLRQSKVNYIQQISKRCYVEEISNQYHNQPKRFRTNKQRQLLRQNPIFEKINPKAFDHGYQYHNRKISEIKVMPTNFRNAEQYTNSYFGTYNQLTRNPQSSEQLNFNSNYNSPKRQEEKQEVMVIPMTKINRKTKKINQIIKSNRPQQSEQSNQQDTLQTLNKQSSENAFNSSLLSSQKFTSKRNSTEKYKTISHNYTQNTQSENTTVIPSFLIKQPFQQLFLCLKCKEYFPTIQIAFHQANCETIKQQIQITRQQNKQLIYITNDIDQILSNESNEKQRKNCQCLHPLKNKKKHKYLTSKSKLQKITELLKSISQINASRFQKLKIKIGNGNLMMGEKYVDIKESSFLKYKLISNHLVDYLKDIQKLGFGGQGQKTMYHVKAIIGTMTEQQCILNKQMLYELIKDLIFFIQQYLEQKQTKKFTQIAKKKYMETQTPYFCFF